MDDFASGFDASPDYAGMTSDKRARIKSINRDIEAEFRKEQDRLITVSMTYFWLLMLAQDSLREGAAECREMMATFVECGGHPDIAASIRANWSPRWGADPNRLTPPHPKSER